MRLFFLCDIHKFGFFCACNNNKRMKVTETALTVDTLVAGALVLVVVAWVLFSALFRPHDDMTGAVALAIISGSLMLSVSIFKGLQGRM